LITHLKHHQVTGYHEGTDFKYPIIQATSLRGFGDQMAKKYQFVVVPSHQRPQLIEGSSPFYEKMKEKSRLTNLRCLVSVNIGMTTAIEFGKHDYEFGWFFFFALISWR